ncbi:hypothetical protein FHL15_007453 [Xylaria flabelliformis]|uniref:Uncharacterized protein n=1 Tax=Xylaria flabelliformis TaxID=2512241 RepID=A0A553HUP6_9PEZI|nr:hypothetical protein FHL15_007453 [Xylaria flabelliformis]
MEPRCQLIRPRDARQYRQRSVSALTRFYITQDLSTVKRLDYSETPATRHSPKLALSPNTYEELTAVKLAQNEVEDHVRAQALVMRERQYEELRTIRLFRESAAREKRERELSHQQQMDDFERMILEFETRQGVEERTADLIRREVRMAPFREYMTRRRAAAARQRQIEQDRMLAEQMEAVAIFEVAGIQAQEAAEQREQTRRQHLRECVVCMEEDDMSDMIQVPCEHWYCLEDLHRPADSLCRRNITMDWT